MKKFFISLFTVFIFLAVYNPVSAFTVVSSVQVAPQLVSGSTYCIPDIEYDTIQSFGTFGRYEFGRVSSVQAVDGTFTSGGGGTGGNDMDCTGNYTVNLSSVASGYTGLAQMIFCTKTGSWSPSSDSIKCVYSLFDIVSGVITPQSGSVPDGEMVIEVPVDSTTVGSPVLIQGLYSNGSTYNGFHLETTDVTASNVFDTMFPLPLINGSDLPFSVTIPLALNREYSIRVRLHDSFSDTYGAWSDSVSFDVSAVVVPPQEVENETCEDTWDIACQLRNAIRFLVGSGTQSMTSFSSLIDTLSISFPFSFLTDIYNVFVTLDDASSEELPSLTLDFTDTAIPMTVEMFDADMLDDYFPETLADTIKSLIEIALYLSMAWFIYTQILGLLRDKS